MGDYEKVNAMAVFSNKALAANEVVTSGPIPIKIFSPNGFFSTYVSVVGLGAVTLNYLLSHDGVNYCIPTSASSIVASFTAQSGVSGSLGRDVFQFNPETAPFMKIRMTERTGVTMLNSVWLAIA